MATRFVEIILDSAALAAHGIEGRDEIEDPLSQDLADSGLGEVTGGGVGGGVATIDVEIDEAADFDAALSFLMSKLRSYGAPADTRIRPEGSSADEELRL